jgi:hypothetical protein
MSPEPDRHSDEFAGTHLRWEHNDGRFDHADRFEVTWLANTDGTGGGWYWIAEARGASTRNVYVHPDAYGVRITTGPFNTSQEAYDDAQGN